MKKMRKLMTILLAFVMILGLGVTAGAETTTYTITINNKAKGHTYEAYQIFAGDLSTNDAGNKVLSNITWGSGVGDTNGTAIIAALKSETAFVKNGENLFKDAANAADVAKVLEKDDFGYDGILTQKFADIVGANLTAVTSGTCTENPDSTDPEKAENYTISGLTAGYYLVKDQDTTMTGKDDAYTRFLLRVVGDAEADPKSDTPDVEKKILDPDDNTKVVDNEAAIGEDVKYELSSKVPDMTGYETYTMIFHDKLSKGLTYNNNVVVTINGTVLAGDKYSVETSAIPADDEDTVYAGGTYIKVTVTDIKSYAKDSAVLVTYTAKLNENAVVGGTAGNPNKVYLEYSNNPNGTGTGKTPEKDVRTFTTEIKIKKVDENSEVLTGATFKLESTDTALPAVSKEAAVNDEGLLNFSGLRAGTYKLTETKAPDGYNRIEPITFKITFDPTAKAFSITDVTPADTAFAQANNTFSITIQNLPGSALPGTGGIGTTIFYVTGTILMLAAAILLITKRRMAHK